MGNTTYQTQRTTMVDCQIRPADVTKYPIIEAMLNCPREEFVSENLRAVAYLGDHLDINIGRVLLDPRVFAKMLNEVDIKPNEFVLDIGCGFGYSTAIISHLAEAVVALEENESMSAAAQKNLSNHDVDNAVCQKGNLVDGAPKFAPYDVIIIEGGIEFLPQPICDQLKEEGRIACVFGERSPGECRIGIKKNDHISWRAAFNAEVPLINGFNIVKEFAF